MNAPDRFELFVLSDGEPKLTVQEDTKIPNAATITINKEDHTLANMLRAQLLTLPYVIFSGYKVPHPLEPKCILKVQTNGERSPIQAVEQACHDLILSLNQIRTKFAQEVAFASARGDGDGLATGMEDDFNF